MSFTYECKSLANVPPFVLSIKSTRPAYKMFGVPIVLNIFAENPMVIIDINSHPNCLLSAIERIERFKARPSVRVIVIVESCSSKALIMQNFDESRSWVTDEVDLNASFKVPGFEHLELHPEELAAVYY